MFSRRLNRGISRKRLIFGFLVASLLLLLGVIGRSACAQIVIEAGQHALLPNTPNQRINIDVQSNGSLISGLNLNVEIGDGVGALSEPLFQGAEGSLEGVDFGSSIFAGNPPSGMGPASGFPQLINGGIVSTTNVEASGTLVSLLVDTTGFNQPGDSFALRLGSHLSPFPIDTQLLGPIGNANPVPVTINNGLLAIASPNTLAGDYNQDGDVNSADYTVWRDSFASASAIGIGADGNGSGSIDGGDFLIWQRNFGSSVSVVIQLEATAQVVPEPSTAVLIAAGWVVSIWNRRNR